MLAAEDGGQEDVLVVVEAYRTAYRLFGEQLDELDIGPVLLKIQLVV